MSDDQKKKPGATTDMSRRTALARLGIGAALAYGAPTVLHLDRSANATLSSTPCERGRNKARWCRRKDRDDDRGRGKNKDKGKAKGKDRDDDRRGRSSRVRRSSRRRD